MTDDVIIQPKWLVLTHEKIRVSVEMVPSLDALIEPGEQFITIKRDIFFGKEPRLGNYFQVFSDCAGIQSGVIFALNKRIYVACDSPMTEPALLSSRLWLSLQGLPVGFSPTKHRISPLKAVKLLHWEEFQH